MSRILVLTVLLAGLTLLGSSLPSRAPAEQDTNKKPAVKEKPAVKNAPTTAQSLVKMLLTTVDFEPLEDPKDTLIEALDKLAKVYRVTFDVNERAFKYEMLNDVLKTEIANPNPIPAMKTTLGTVLRKILERVSVPSGATYLIRHDRIEITTNQFATAEIRNQREQPRRAKASPTGAPMAQDGLGKEKPQTEDEQDAGRFYVPIVSIVLERQPLEEALRQIQLQANISFVIDPALGEKARQALTLTLLNAPLDSAVLVLMELTELDSVWLDNIFYVTSRDKAHKLRTTWPARHSGSGPGILLLLAGRAGM